MEFQKVCFHLAFLLTKIQKNGIFFYMDIVIYTALGVGLATIIGAVIGFLFTNLSQKFNDMVLGFASGIMLCAAVVGLIIPSFSVQDKFSPIVTTIGIFCGALFLNLVDKFVPHTHNLMGRDLEEHQKTRINKTMLFVLAIAIHNFPEGLSAGVGFGTGNTVQAISIAIGIALQNIPEGMVIIAPLILAGLSKKKTLLIAFATGFVEIIGTLIGYLAVNISPIFLPFLLAFAGGTMLYIISDEMIPETHSHGNQTLATYSLLVGFCVMLVIDFFLG